MRKLDLIMETWPWFTRAYFRTLLILRITFKTVEARVSYVSAYLKWCHIYSAYVKRCHCLNVIMIICEVHKKINNGLYVCYLVSHFRSEVVSLKLAIDSKLSVFFPCSITLNWIFPKETTQSNLSSGKQSRICYSI